MRIPRSCTSCTTASSNPPPLDDPPRLLVHHARRATRTDGRGRLLRLEEQDRSAWDRELIGEADRLVVRVLGAGLEALERDHRLAGYRYLPATKADLLHRLGRDAEAVDAYQAALTLTDNATEQEFLVARARSTRPTC
jgi:predicted RNA polymerase sigma factor